jgi:hypothetical protein
MAMDEGLEHFRRARLKSVLLLLAVFVAGTLAGAAGDEWFTRRPAAPASGARHVYPGVLGRMHLTAAQHVTIDSLFDRERPRNEAILSGVLPILRGEADSLRASIRAVLTPDQQRLFDLEHRSARADRASLLDSTPAR